MRAPSNNSKSLLPLIEIIISVLIFAIASMLSLNIFLLSRDVGIKATDTSVALFQAQSVVETLKGCDTSEQMRDAIKEIFGVTDVDFSGPSIYTMKFSEQTSATPDAESKTSFTLTLQVQEQTNSAGSIYVIKADVTRNKQYFFLKKGTDFTPLLVSIENAKYISGKGEILYG